MAPALGLFAFGTPMADICTASASPNACGHYDLTATVAGISTSVHVHDVELRVPLTSSEREELLKLSARILRQTGVTPAQFLNRVLRGDEATNVKQYTLLGPGATVTKTNIGTSYVNVLPGLNGERVLVDFTGCTQFRAVLTANLVGTGPFGARIVKDADNAVLYEDANIAVTGERELDTDWQPIPAGFTALEIVRLQAKSVTAADDPVYRRGVLLVR